MSKKVVIIFILCGLIGGVFSFYTKPANAGFIPYIIKEFVIYPLVRMIANSLENKLVNKMNSTISNINSKGPTFITNWRNHMLDSQARGNDVFKAVLADAKVCGFMKSDVLNAFGADKSVGAIKGAKITDALDRVVYENKTNIPGLPSFQNLADCTLPSDLNVDLFKKDFSKGGWTAWNQLIKPQNNFFGIYSLALNEQQRQIETEKKAAMDSAVAGQGFLSQKLGVVGSGIGPSGCTGTNRYKMDEKGKLTPDWTGSRCTFMGKEVTPAKLLGESNANALDKKLGRVGGATQITDILLSLASAVLDATTNRLVNFIGQSTYDRPPSQDADGFPEAQITPGPDDPQYDANKICQNDCTRGKEISCSNEPGANDCVETDPDTGACLRTGYDDCISQAQSECSAQCASATSPSY